MVCIFHFFRLQATITNYSKFEYHHYAVNLKNNKMQIRIFFEREVIYVSTGSSN
ncbi:hypothetical protein CMALT394_360020 [Carnobacterium maltaromaticum]|nr:hypothetical protein CMALT394_360020 [Carnobacterium maltaromaticum]